MAAAITRAFLGAVIIYAFSSWRPSFHYRFESVKGLVRFGLPYQGNQILNFMKDAVTPLFVGAYAGAAAVGYVMGEEFCLCSVDNFRNFRAGGISGFFKLQDDREFLGGLSSGLSG